METIDVVKLGLIALGAVNVALMFRPNLESKYKWLLSFGVALVFLLLPESLGNVVMDKVKVALEVAFAASGGYKLASKAGGE